MRRPWTDNNGNCYCRNCRAYLSPDNFSPSNIQSRRRLCRKCHGRYATDLAREPHARLLTMMRRTGHKYIPENVYRNVIARMESLDVRNLLEDQWKGRSALSGAPLEACDARLVWDARRGVMPVSRTEWLQLRGTARGSKAPLLLPTASKHESSSESTCSTAGAF